jgi:hypothetical protein
MSAARLLGRARAAGLSLAIEGENIIVEADDEPSPELIAELRQHKTQLIAALSHLSVLPEYGGTEWVNKTVDGLWWHDLYAELTGHWFHGARHWHEAEALAWGELEVRWNRAHGAQVPSHLCAGCRRPIGAAEAFDLEDGNRVHDANDHDCLRRHGERWRGTARRALIEMGLSPQRRTTCRERPPLTHDCDDFHAEVATSQITPTEQRPVARIHRSLRERGARALSDLQKVAATIDCERPPPRPRIRVVSTNGEHAVEPAPSKITCNSSGRGTLLLAGAPGNRRGRRPKSGSSHRIGLLPARCASGLALPQACAPNVEAATYIKRGLSSLAFAIGGYRMRTLEEIPDIPVRDAARLEVLGQPGIQLLIGEVGKIARLALLAALDEQPEHLAEEFRRADRRRQLSPLPRELMVSDEHAKNSCASKRCLANRTLDDLRLYLVALVEELLYSSDHVCPLSDFPGRLAIAR